MQVLVPRPHRELLNLGSEVVLDGEVAPPPSALQPKNPRDLLPPLVALRDTPPVVLEALARRAVYVLS